MQRTDAQASRQRRARLPYQALSVIISGLIIAAGLAIMYRRLDWQAMVAVWEKLDSRWLPLALLAPWMQYPINSFRLHQVIRRVSGKLPPAVPSWKLIFKMTCSSGFIASAAPIGLTGDVAKIAALRLFGNLSITDATRYTLFDRVVGVQWISIFGLAALPIQASAGVGGDIIVPQAALFGGLLAAVACLLAVSRILLLVPFDLFTRLARLFMNYKSLLRLWPSTIQMLIGILNLFSAWATLYLLLLATGLDTNLWLVAAFIPLLQLINSFPFLYMGWGGRELAMAATLGTTGGLTMNEALAVSAEWGIILVAAGAINGVFLLGNWQPRRTEPAAREVEPPPKDSPPCI
jgi:uncharacterized membrane protein YbhN (UPF0104 family)